MWDKKVREELSKAFLDALKEDTIPWRKCWNGMLTSFSTGKPYQGINNLMLAYVADQRGYRDPRWITYRQAQERGWQVRKGEKSARIEYWFYYDRVTKEKLDREEVFRIQKEEPERMKDIYTNAKCYSVFNVEQVDGDIPPLQKSTIQDPSALIPFRDEFLENLGVNFREGGDRACYSPSTDTITLPYPDVFDSDYAYISTLLHETGHSTGHASRLNRPMAGSFGTPEYAKEELRAEIASAFTAQALQLPYNEEALSAEVDNHKAYIQNWIEILEKDPNELFTAIKDANKIADYVLERGQLLELTLVAEEEREPEENEQDCEELEDEWER